MKSKLTMVVSLLFLGISCFSITACDEEKQGTGAAGEVSDVEWESRLNLNFESVKSCTIIMTEKPTYDVSQAQEYGEYYSDTITMKVDTVNQIIYRNNTYTYYDEGTEKVYTSYHQSYDFCIDGKYYSVDYDDDSEEYPEETPEWTCREITKADFIENMESVGNTFAALGVYADPMLKDYIFKYNSETGAYEMDASYGTAGYSLKFLNNGGIQIIMQSNSLSVMTEEFYDIDKTVVSVPDNVMQVALDFVAANAEEN